MKVEMANRCFSKNNLSFSVMVVYLLMFGAGAWASSIVSSQTSPDQRWRPRRIPVGAELVGDGVCARCHAAKTASYAKTGMAMAMESIAESKVLTANPAMTFRIGNYAYEIKRKDKQSIYSVTDGKETISLPILYAFGEGKAGKLTFFSMKARSMKVVSFMTRLEGWT
jgi:hypothetical protein